MKLLRLGGMLAYCGLLFALFAVTAYFSFNLFIRSGVTRAPDLAGMTREQAIAALEERGLAWGGTANEGRYSEEVPAGQIVQQQPAAGGLVKRGSRVAVVLSLGPQRQAVPELLGLSVAAAETTAGSAGLHLGRALSVWDSSGRPGTVVAQRPAAGANVRAESPVDLLVAQGGRDDAYVMPDLVSRDYETVRRRFSGQGFRFEAPRTEAYEGIPRGVILRQEPLAGHPVTRRDAILLVVSSGSP